RQSQKSPTVATSLFANPYCDLENLGYRSILRGQDLSSAQPTLGKSTLAARQNSDRSPRGWLEPPGVSRTEFRPGQGWLQNQTANRLASDCENHCRPSRMRNTIPPPGLGNH